MDRVLLRATGVATAAYGLAVTVRPELLAVPSGLARPGAPLPRDAKACLRPLTWRDAACGVAMALAPDDRSLRTAAIIRIASDFGDAALLATALPTRRNRVMAVTVSLAWGALSAAGLLRTPRARVRPGATLAGPRRHRRPPAAT